jgi:hypothetical protein
MADQPERSDQAFKTAWFSKAARNALIDDEELCKAIRQVMLGQPDDLGGGVFKKRLDKNRSRSIILERVGHYWVYEFLFAKKDRANITYGELAKFRDLAKSYRVLTEQRINEFTRDEVWMEICNGTET